MAKLFIDVWSDYVCPFCYLQLPVLKQVANAEKLTRPVARV